MNKRVFVCGFGIIICPVAVTYKITDFDPTVLDFLDKLKEWLEKHNDMIA